MFLRSVPNPPDAVAFPDNEQDIVRILAWCDQIGAKAIPYGGGSSVVKGIEPAAEFEKVVTISMRHMDKVLEVDPISHAARIEGGVYGPHIEDQLRETPFTMRHYMQCLKRRGGEASTFLRLEISGVRSILLTGGTGHLGQDVVNRLVQAGHRVRVLPGRLGPRQMSNGPPAILPRARDCGMIRVIDTGHTDTDDTTALHIPSLGLLIAGDAIYNETHPFLVESDRAGRQAWLAAIDRLAAINPQAVVVGHGPLDPDCSPRHLDATRRYIRDFDRVDPEAVALSTASFNELFASLH